MHFFWTSSWVEENKLDQLEFARQRQAFCSAAPVFSPDMSDARSSWAEAGGLTLVIDDFFDVGGSRDEQVNLITLVERYDKLAVTICFLYTIY